MDDLYIDGKRVLARVRLIDTVSEWRPLITIGGKWTQSCTALAYGNYDSYMRMFVELKFDESESTQGQQLDSV